MIAFHGCDTPLAVHIPGLPSSPLLAVALIFISLTVANAEEAKPDPGDPLPKILGEGGAMTDADLASWVAEDPTRYSSHYVSQSITDGWEDMLVTVRNAGSAAEPHWIVDVYVRDTRDDAHKDGATYSARPLVLGPHPSFQLQEGGETHYFALRTQKAAKGSQVRRVLVTSGGALFNFSPEVPENVVLSGKDIPLKFQPWQENDPSAYAGTYISQSRAAGSREVEVTVKKAPKSQLPWRVDMANTTTGTQENYPDYEYEDRPLWLGFWPHFNAHDTFIFIRFADPRGSAPLPLPALITEKGEVLVRLERPTK